MENRKTAQAGPGSVLLHLRPVPEFPEATLILFPGAGAGPGYFRDWRTLVPGEWALAAVNLPGRAARLREPLPDNLHVVVTEITAAAIQFHAAARVICSGTVLERSLRWR